MGASESQGEASGARDIAELHDRWYLEELVYQCEAAQHRYAELEKEAHDLVLPAEVVDGIRRHRTLFKRAWEGAGLVELFEKKVGWEKEAALVREEVERLVAELQAHEDEARTPRKPRPDEHLTLRIIHSFLTHCANVAKLVYPSTNTRAGPSESTESRRATRKRVRLRGARLRTALSTASLPGVGLLRQTATSDHLEHFDHRIDAWLAEMAELDIAVFMPYTVGPAEAMFGGDAARAIPRGFMRHFDPGTMIFYAMGDAVALRDLHAVIGLLRERAVCHLKETTEVLAGPGQKHGLKDGTTKRSPAGDDDCAAGQDGFLSWIRIVPSGRVGSRVMGGPRISQAASSWVSSERKPLPVQEPLR